jgi:hypothetical protein
MDYSYYSSVVMFDDEFDVEFEISITDEGYRGSWDDPGAGAEFDVLDVYVDNAKVSGAQKKLLIDRNWSLIQTSADDYVDSLRW